MKRSVILITIGGILAIMAITNPSEQSFREKFGSTRNEGLIRNNYILYSIYKQNFLISGQTYTLKYMGIFGTFFEVSKK